MRPLFLHGFHQGLGATFGERDGAELAQAYGNSQAEWVRLSVVAVSDRSFRGLIACKGPETLSYLHGMVTNEVKGLKAGQGTYAAVITARGKMLGDVRLLVLSEGEALLDMEPGAHPGTLAHLQQFLISEDCELSDATGAFVIFGVHGPLAEKVVAAATGQEVPALAEHGVARRDIGGEPGLLVASNPEGARGFDLFVAPSAAEGVASALVSAAKAAGGGPVGEEAREALRIGNGIPRFGADMNESTIPLEANLERAISYTKGCYIGQEVIAKATYRGHVRRRLARLSVPPGTPAGTQLLDGEKSLGLITSVLDPNPAGGPPLALGYVRAANLSVGARLPIEGGGEAFVVWAPPPGEP